MAQRYKWRSVINGTALNHFDINLIEAFVEEILDSLLTNHNHVIFWILVKFQMYRIHIIID